MHDAAVDSETLAGMVSDPPNPEVARRALKTLSRTRSPQAIPPAIQAFLKGLNAELQATGAIGLGQYEDADARRALTEATSTLPQP